MRKSSKDICKQVSEKYGYDLDMVKSVSETLFKILEDKVRNPTHLIINCSPLGSFFFRHTKSRNLVGKGKYPEIIFEDNLKKILELYKVYDKDKLDFKIERFGEESHKAYLLGKEQKKLQNKKKVELKKYNKFSRSRNQTSPE